MRLGAKSWCSLVSDFTFGWRVEVDVWKFVGVQTTPIATSSGTCTRCRFETKLLVLNSYLLILYNSSYTGSL